MAPPLLTLQTIGLTFGGTALLESAELSVSANERLCLVGRNGSGKSTFLKIAAGLVEPDRGKRFVQPGTTIRYLPQEPDLEGFDTVLSYVEDGMMPGDDHYRAAYLLGELGLSGTEDPATLSGGEARRAALARAMAPDPDILLLDEPTNHLDLPAIEWLENELRGMRSALVLISHDRRFLETLSKTTVWLERGVTRRMDKSFAHFEAWRDEVLEQEELDRHKLDRKIVAEEHWVRYGVTARRKRNQGRMRALQDLRNERRDQRKVTGSVKMTVSEGATSGRLVAKTKAVSKAYDGRPIVEDLSMIIQRGDRLGIVGPNGAGKTTLLRLLTGDLEPDAGTVKLGTNLAMVSLDQRRASLDPQWTLSEALTDGRGDMVEVAGQQKHVIAYMKDFLFAPEQARTPISALSGGERGRLMLARALAQPSNLLVLDEPTNDLDLETLDLLQETIANYPGTVILVSHDRDFLDRTATSVLAGDGDGRWIEYAGGYSDMVAQRGSGVTARDAGEPAGKPAKKQGNDKAPPKPDKQKLSFKDSHALKTLPKRMEELSTEIARHQKTLADPGFYARDPERFAKLSSDLEARAAELAATEERWLELEMLREELEGSA
ncbi:ATP-binding cassette domain-containing protein [Breoghania sp. L-A4]|uniref:ABC-F family ATP-binding cassette domain-containing protein n=1 Tax=Breoghania sp. L-A4 TaxID=2304600 RepID=UPI000E35E052|nr:ATP-binding cassette domain-containing protein [Breoghania sp. L-A4]AXS39298.1 ATP-binding cassette domain-containing protein [Breoghania sp. L-A4]